MFDRVQEEFTLHPIGLPGPRPAASPSEGNDFLYKTTSKGKVDYCIAAHAACLLRVYNVCKVVVPAESQF